MQDSIATLAQLHSNGIALGIEELLCYQQFAKQIDLTPRKTPQAKLAGGYVTKHKGRGMEFDEARHYQAGDDIRAIDWRVTARTGKTHTKVYREERERPVIFVCDQSKSMQFGTRLMTKAMQAAHCCAALAWAATSRGDRVGGVVFDSADHKECKPMTRKRALLAWFHDMQTINNQAVERMAKQGLFSSNETSFSDMCVRLRRLARPGSLVYLVSDFSQLNDTNQLQLFQLARHCELRALIIEDPLEVSLPSSPQVQALNVTNGQQEQTWYIGDSAQQQQYQQQRERITSQQRTFFQQSKISAQRICAGTPLQAQITKLHQVGLG